MTSRPQKAVQPPPAHQRSASGSTLPPQRSSHQQRSISQSYHPQSPSRKDNAAAGDLAGAANHNHNHNPDPADVAQNRHATTPRRGGSKLRLELSHDPSITPGPMTESPQGLALTPSRTSQAADTTDGGNMSPAPSHGSDQDVEIPPVPMPQRRTNLQRFVPSSRGTAPTASATKRDGKPKPYTIEFPSDAPRYHATSKQESVHRDPFNKGLFSGHADFFPWNGNHHEDEWSTEAIQKGTWDRGSQNETSSARLAVYPSLKQKTGLNALSTIFMGVLNQRRNRGQVTAPSTFKPPPRVTLTDTKREVWLKDLANPTISLRRLSRTIPHGIRGRTLLDQCLNKNVPTERAVWLAKCVGANEIRAVKRKGVNGAFVMGGELKWIRDWTIFVEQFVDAIVSSVGAPDWKERVTYAIRLATSLYCEHLLDRDHYLDWIMSGLESSPQARIPMWILVAQICWTDILRARKHGRRLVFSLLNHLNTIYNDPDKDILIQLSNQLSILLQSLLRDNPESFIHPPLWLKYRECLLSYLPAEARSAQEAYRNINARNTELLVSNTASPPAGMHHLVKLLDSTLYGPVDGELAAKCWACSDDKALVVKTVAEWATSFHRPGLGKVYVAAGLLRTWSVLRVNTTGAILDTLDSVATEDKARKNHVYHLVTELARTGHFSVSQYIQWLIARGGCHDASDVDPETGPCASRLLVELPVHCLTEERRMDRANLLRRAANYDVADETRDIEIAINCIDRSIGFHSQDEAQIKAIPLRKLLNRVKHSSNALKSSLGAHLRDNLRSFLPPQLDADISAAMFTSIRTVLETTEDFSMMADILRTCSKMTNIEILALCTDTINANLPMFLALEVAGDVFMLYFERLKLVGREHGLIARPLLASLSSLAQRMPGRDEMAKNLQQELMQSDRSNPIDACSPVSDNMVNQAQTPESEVSEQIDKLLASGNSVDNPTMNRLFMNICPRLESGWSKLDPSRRVFASLLSRLRIFDVQHFDKLMADWISHIRSLKERPPLVELLPLLVSVGCLTVSTMLQTANAAPVASNIDMTGTETSPQGASIYLQELLKLVLCRLPKSNPLTAEEAYRFVVYQQSAKLEHAKALLSLIRNAVLEYSILHGRTGGLSLPLDDPTCQGYVLETLRLLVVADSTAAAEALSIKDLGSDASTLVRTIAAKLLVPGDNCSPKTSFDKILGLANDLTMPFCQLTLNMELSLAQPNQDGGDDQQESQFDVFARAMDSAIEARNIMWTSMLPCLSDDITQHLKSQAHTRYLNLIPSSKAAGFVDMATSEDRIQLAKNLLGVIEAIISGQPPSKSSQLTGILVDKLMDLWEVIAMNDPSIAAAQDAIRKHWLPSLLRFVTLHSISAEPSAALATAAAATAAAQIQSPSAVSRAVPAPNHEARARIIIVLCGILFELESQPLTPSAELAQQVFDVSVLLVDSLPDDLRAQCAKAVIAAPAVVPSKTATSDSRMYYLFSAQRPTPADNLLLAHRDKASVPLSAAARGLGAMYGIGPTLQEKYSPFVLRRWEVLSEPTPNVGENDTSLSLGLFEAIKIQ